MRVKHLVVTAAITATAACAPTPPRTEQATEDAITLRYTAYHWFGIPTVTAEALDKATAHCAQYGKTAEYIGGGKRHLLTDEELHVYACRKN